MRINGYNPASMMTGPDGDPRAIGEGQVPGAPFDAQGPGMAPPEMVPMLRIEPVAAGAPAGSDTRFLAQLAGQFLDPGETRGLPRDAYADPLDRDADERPYWTGRPVKFWA